MRRVPCVYTVFYTADGRETVVFRTFRFSVHRKSARCKASASACRKTFFGTLGDCQKGSEDEQLTPVGVYRYGRA